MSCVDDSHRREPVSPEFQWVLYTGGVFKHGREAGWEMGERQVEGTTDIKRYVMTYIPLEESPQMGTEPWSS